MFIPEISYRVFHISHRVKVEVKVKLSLCLTKIHATKMYLYLTKHHAMNIYLGSGGIAPYILNLSTRWN
jgi:hypothetical protein